MVKKLFKNKVFKNFSYLTAGSIISQFLLLITVIKITNVFSPDEYGLYTFIMAQGLLLEAISNLGIKSIIIRAIARNPERTNDLIVNGIKLRFAALIILMGLYVIYNFYLGRLEINHLIILGLYTLLMSLFHISEYVFLGNQKMFFPSVIKVIHSFSWFAIVLLLPRQYFEVNLLLSIYLILLIIQISIYYNLIQKQGLFTGKIEKFWVSSRSLVNEGWPYFAMMLLTLPSNHFTNNFLDINSVSEEIGYFNLAKKLMSPVTLITTFALTALFPNLAVMFEANKEKFSKMISGGVSIYIIVIALFSFLFTMFSREVIVLFFSDSYLPAVKVVQLQIWYVMLTSINHLITIIYGAVNQEKKIFKLALVYAIISTPLLYYGSYYGALGISIGYVVSIVLYEIYYWKQFTINIKLPITKEKFIWISAIFLFAISYFIPEETNLLFKIGISATILLFYLVYFKKEYSKLILKRI